MSEIDVDYLKQWVGKEQTTTDDLDPFKANALSAALVFDQTPLDVIGVGDGLPPAWQWLYFSGTPSGFETGVDGHPKTGGFLPPVPLQRRMWAAGKFTVKQPLLIGQRATKTSRVASVEHKQGSTGDLVFVTLENEIAQANQVCVVEEQNIVYRDMQTGPSPLSAGKKAPEDAQWESTVVPDPVMLFRFSALTYNSHRIHYDRAYAVEKEHYPGLVVHGPLQALLLANAIHAFCDQVQVSDFQFRAQRPIFDAHPFELCGKREGDKVSLWTRDHEGFVGMSASATLSEVK